jgi:hypothetical protein
MPSCQSRNCTITASSPTCRTSFVLCSCTWGAVHPAYHATACCQVRRAARALAESSATCTADTRGSLPRGEVSNDRTSAARARGSA